MRTLPHAGAHFLLGLGVIEALVPGPGDYANDRFFNDDLSTFDREQLLAERSRLRWRVSFEDPRTRDLWPFSWFVERLARVERMLGNKVEPR